MLSETIKKIESFLTQYEKVILLIEPYFSWDIGTDFCTEKSVLILSEKPLRQNVGNVSFLQVSKDELEEMINLYHTYEFSDCFKVIFDSHESFGGVLNLRRTGILKDEEVFNIMVS